MQGNSGRHIYARVSWLTLSLLVLCATARAQFLQFAQYPVPTANSLPGCIVEGPDQAMWFTEAGEFANNIGRITTAGAVTEYPIPTFNSRPSCIRVGPDGALWFTEGNGNNIGRITTAGAITEYPIPTAGSGPSGIKAGPDGALWFTEQIGNKIGQITTAGVITEFTIPTAASAPVGIAAGLDGALWFTESAANQIGRITTAGVITEYPIPTATSRPWTITTGPDGALWFTEATGNQIGRITTAGVVTAEYAVPTAASIPFGITVGPDGALWFTERSGNKIGRITTAGAISEYAIPIVPGQPHGIAVGADGAFWITGDASNSIIHAAIVAQAPPLSIFTSSPLPNGSVGVKYAQALSATGGTPPYTWSVTAGSLPAGLTLNSTTGRITGTPTTSGTAAFTVQVMDTPATASTQVFALTIAPNNISQFPVPASLALGGITAGPDGALWFTSRNANIKDQAGRITTSGTITEYGQLTCNCATLSAIVTGSDGALWFGDGFNIEQITTAGVITQYPVAGAINIDGITSGPDGALWFTDAQTNFIGRITTAGAITQYLVPSHAPSANGIYGIATGPDGALWFTEAVGYIGRITTAGVITEFAVQAVPTAIAAGPDSALWFTDSNGAIDRITVAGVVTNYATPTAGSAPAGITLGPDGAMWFTEAEAGNIGRITTGGAITEYPIPAADVGSPGSITSGPDGALWFTMTGPNGGAIGRLLPPPTLTSIAPFSGAQGATVPVVLTGSSFVPGGTTVNVPAAITVSNLNVVSPTQATATFTIAPAAVTGPASVTVTTAGGTSQPVNFTITPPPPPPPTLTSIFPASGVEGTSVPVTLTGTNFIAGPTIIGSNFFDNYTQTVPLSPTPTTIDNGQLTVTATIYPDPSDPNSQWVDFNFQSVNAGPLASNPSAFWQAYLANIPLIVPGTLTGVQYYWTVNGTAAPNITAISGLNPVVPNLINPALGLVYGAQLQGVTPHSLFSLSTTLSNYAAGLQQGNMNSASINGFHIAARTSGGVFGGAAVSVSNPGVSVNNLTLVSSTQINATFNIAANAALGPANVTVSNAAGTSAPVTFTVVPPAPTLTSISPNAGTVGTAVNAMLLGSNFVTGGTTVSVTGGVMASNVAVTGSGQLTATLTIPPATAPGPVNVTVITAGGTSGPVVFTIDAAPMITTASPLPNGTVGSAYSQAVSVSGGTPPYTWHVTAGSLPAGLALDPTTCTSDPHTTCLIAGTPTAFGTSQFTLQVIDGSGATASAPFALTINPIVPAITSIAPSSGAQGASVPVTLAGTNFVPGATVAISNAGVTVSNVVVVGPTQITATFAIASNAALGAANVTVTTSGGTSAPASFTIIPPPPVLTTIAPASGAPGTSVPVTLTGNNFVAGAVVAAAGGVTVSNVTVVSLTQITATFTIGTTAVAGPVNVTVTTSGGTSGPVTFTITSLLLTSISPANGAQGASVPVILTGAGFAAGAQVVTGSSSVTASNVVVVSATEITATLNISAKAVPGPVNITVTSGGVTSAPVTFTVGPPAAVTLTSITPAYAAQGASVPVTLTGTGFVAGAQIVVGNAVTASNIVVVSSTEITATFNVAANAIPGPANVKVFSLGGASGPVTFTVVSLLLSSVSPANGAQGASVPVVLTGAGFAAGAQVALSNAGVTVSNVVVVSATQLTATLNISATAATGPAALTVTVAGVTSAPVTFSIGPPAKVTLTSISPAYGGQGVSIPVTLNGTGFVAGAQIAISNPGITASNIVVVSTSQITATFTIAPTAALGAARVTVTSLGGTSETVIFTVISLQLTSISPATGAQGASVPVTLTGAGFAAGAQVAASSAGVTFSNVAVVSATQITATLNISATATPGPTGITVTVGGYTSAAVTFTITPPPAVTLTSINPAYGAQGTSLPVTLSGTGFVAGAQIGIGNSGVTAGNIVVVSATQITATFTVGASAALGATNVTVTLPSGTTGPVTFTVLAPLKLISISPAAGSQGASVPVTLIGAGFAPGAQISINNAGVTAGNIVVGSSTQITATFNISATAAVGAANVTVTVGGATSAAVTFTVNPGAPTLTSITPASAPQGTSVAVTLIGTNFVAGATITAANSGVTAGNIVVVSAAEITATLTVAEGAALGATTITVGTSGGTSGPVSFTVGQALVFTLTGLPATISPGQQIPFTVTVPQPYPQDVSGELTLQFTPGASLPSDPTIALAGGQCAAGTCTVTFTIPAGQTSAGLSLQTGTVTGTLLFTITNVTVGGVPVTLTNNPTLTASAPAEAPSITNVSIVQMSSGFNIVVTGYSNTREISEADFTFTPTPGSQLQTSTFSLTDVAATFQAYYSSSASTPVGGEFVYTQPFNLTAGSISTLQSVSVTLKNTQGSSAAATASF